MKQHQNDPDYTTEPIKKEVKWYHVDSVKALFTGLALFFGIVLSFIAALHFGWIDLTQERINIIAISMLMTWGVVLVGYYVWAIYTYNVNLGYHQKFWDILWQKIREARIRKKAGLPPLEEEPTIPNENPYKAETLGLPHGTVRGTIALTLLVGSLAMMIVAIGAINGNESTLVASHLTESQNILFNRLFDFFVVAFQMMIAFYFGANSLKYLRGVRGGGDPVPVPSPQPPTPTSGPDLDEEEEEIITPPADSGEAVQTGLTMEEKDFQQKARAAGIQPAVLRAIAEFASGGQGYIQEAGNETGEGRLALTFDGKAFFTEMQKAGHDPRPLVQKYPKILWDNCHSFKGQPGPMAYNLLHEALHLCSTMGISKKTALYAGNWGLFGIPGKYFAQAGYPDIINLQNKFELSESFQFDAFIALCKNKQWFTLLQDAKMEAFAKGYWGACAEPLSYGEELEALRGQYVKLGWNETSATGPQPKTADSMVPSLADAGPGGGDAPTLGGHRLLDPVEVGESEDV
jgi:hypothetical protein